jgi:hypothetical protein
MACRLPLLYLIGFPIVVHIVDGRILESEAGGPTVLLRPKTRIVGGQPATMGQFPYQVLLLLSNQKYW